MKNIIQCYWNIATLIFNCILSDLVYKVSAIDALKVLDKAEWGGQISFYFYLVIFFVVKGIV